MIASAPVSRRVAVVADDHELFRVALTAILTKRLGFDEVIEAGSLDAALERLVETADVTLALFDLAMPGMSSAASLAAVRECFPGVRTVVVSGSTRREDVLLALQVGVHGYVEKGSSVEALERGLRAVVEGQIVVPAFLADVPLRGGTGPAATGDSRVSVDEAVAGLTPRQREILRRLVQGASNKEIARALTLGEGTIKVHLAALFRALGVHNRASAAVIGARFLGDGQPTRE